MTVRVRFAPSPTGHLHFGGARTALFNYLFAKKHKGTYILRIEDTDTTRNKENAEERLIEAFKWLELTWDEGPDIGGNFGPYRSMERLDIYHKYIHQLLATKQAYPCYCTREELEAEREHMISQGKMPRYSGKCRHLTESDRKTYELEGRSFTIRFKVPSQKTLTFKDMIRGAVTFESEDIEDFVILKSDGIPTYHFAVTVDDALMKITHVIRGEEHLSNTPKHLLLFGAFGFQLPEFGHIPLILNESGKKLSKRDESILQFIEQYRDLGYLPKAVINYLTLLGWSPGGEFSEQEIFSKDQLTELFSMDRVSKAGAIFDPDKLAWMNGQYIKTADPKKIVELAIPYLKNDGLFNEDKPVTWYEELVTLYQDRMNCISEITQLARIFFDKDMNYNQDAKEILTTESSLIVLKKVKELISTMDEYTPNTIKKLLKDVQKATGFKGKKLFMPVRVATTGAVQGPDLNTVLYLLGKETVVDRIEQVI
ncbi:glutamate--tRNA ligase [Thermoflavimicrobium daqui]|uniref:Glutamate--tRNA ligase n=1 Tax=Thermoflavimicrobium daqui TaxID=2137476 RepID=A0A364K8I2_9BACL|nr:glutamate--tRNA ligase [Thermoflavimicrobium daqui]RAL26532.1 glutamate--tRNA ligase [Thermoflavimicrobium daqui]